VTLTPHPLLVPWSWQGRAIPLLHLRAVRPVQSLSACTSVSFTFTSMFCRVSWLFRHFALYGRDNFGFRLEAFSVNVLIIRFGVLLLVSVIISCAVGCPCIVSVAAFCCCHSRYQATEWPLCFLAVNILLMTLLSMNNKTAA